MRSKPGSGCSTASATPSARSGRRSTSRPRRPAASSTGRCRRCATAPTPSSRRNTRSGSDPLRYGPADLPHPATRPGAPAPGRDASGVELDHHVLDAGVVLEAVLAEVLAVAGVLEAAVGHLGDE